MTTPRRIKRCCLLSAALASISALDSAHALQSVEARDGATLEATIALKEPTRIKVEGAKITDAFGNIYSSNCRGKTPEASTPSAAPAINPIGELVIQCDEDKGELYVKPIGKGTKPINLFVATERETYTLVLKRADMPADTIVIRDRTPQREAAGGDRAGRAPAHVRAVKAMLRAMAGERAPQDVRVQEAGREVALWQEARFTLLRTYEGRELAGEAYLLTNVSDQPMVLAEREFDREGVLGVAVEHHNLRPGESTNVFVIRGGS